MTLLARFITRPAKDDSDQPDLGLIAFMRGNDLLKAGRVYEIREELGELLIVDIGENVLSGATPHDRFGYSSWGAGIESVLSGGPPIFLTRREHLGDNPPRNEIA